MERSTFGRLASPRNLMHETSCVPPVASEQARALHALRLVEMTLLYYGMRSLRSLFMVSIRASFLDLDHFLSCFSLAMACSTSENDSKYTNLWQLYFCVKPGIVPDLCSVTRLSRSFVTPMYSVVSLLFARMYV